MGKYEVRWCRIWDFTEEVEAETEEETYEKILEERKTQGSTVEILSVMSIDIEKVKQKGKKEKKESTKAHTKAQEPKKGIEVGTLRINIPKKSKEKK